MEAGLGTGRMPAMPVMLVEPVKPTQPVRPAQPTESSSGFRLRKSLERNSVGSICFVWLRLAAECSYA